VYFCFRRQHFFVVFSDNASLFGRGKKLAIPGGDEWGWLDETWKGRFEETDTLFGCDWMDLNGARMALSNCYCR
jgi:hypothetical protein